MIDFPLCTDAKRRTDRKKFESAIKAAAKGGEGAPEGAATDPLNPWLDYIVWTRQTYLQANLKSHLLPLLEKCTRAFLGDARYQENIRYLKVWLHYADMCPDPEEIYRFIRANRIGQTHAVFFEAWAQYLELIRGKVSEAEHVLKHGMQRGAQPRYRLEQALQALQGRALKRVQKQITVQEDDEVGRPQVQAAVSAVSRRQGLSLRSEGEPARPLAESRSNRQPTRGNGSSDSRQPLRGSSNFQVFADDDDNHDKNAQAEAARMNREVAFEGQELMLSCPRDPGLGGRDAGAPVMARLASRRTVDKENTRQAQAWDQGGGLWGPVATPPAEGPEPVSLGDLFGGAAPPRRRRPVEQQKAEHVEFEVYVDEGVRQAEELRRQLRRVASSQQQHQKLQPRRSAGLRAASASSAGARAEKLQADPLRYMSPAEQQSQSSSAPVSSSSSRGRDKQSADSQRLSQPPRRE